MTKTNRTNEFRLIAIGAVISAAFSGIVMYTDMRRQKKIAVVDAVRLFNGFSMKKDMEKGFELKLKSMATRVDSIAKILKSTDVPKDTNTQRGLYRGYLIAKQELDGEYAETNKYINEMVWKRLNTLIDEYGKNQDLDVIIGANGMGSILYNNNYYDKTDDMIRYANNKYNDEQ